MPAASQLSPNSEETPTLTSREAVKDVRFLEAAVRVAEGDGRKIDRFPEGHLLIGVPP